MASFEFRSTLSIFLTLKVRKKMKFRNQLIFQRKIMKPHWYHPPFSNMTLWQFFQPPWLWNNIQAFGIFRLSKFQAAILHSVLTTRIRQNSTVLGIPNSRQCSQLSFYKVWGYRASQQVPAVPVLPAWSGHVVGSFGWMPMWYSIHLQKCL